MTNWKRIDSAPKDQRIIVWVSGRCEIARWVDDRFAKNPSPHWEWDDVRGKTFTKNNQPEWWCAAPAGPCEDAEASK